MILVSLKMQPPTSDTVNATREISLRYQPTYLLIDELHKLLQSIICCNPVIQGLCKLFNFSFKTARLLCKMIQKILNVF